MTKKVQFLAGLFLVCMCVLMLQIVETRILSVISFYHLAFFAISMAMFGMTAGSLIVYFNPMLFAPERLFANVVWITAAFAVVVILSTMMLISTVVIDPARGFLLAVLLWGKVIAALIPPYVFAGMAISLALTRSPWPVGTRLWRRSCRRRIRMPWGARTNEHARRCVRHADDRRDRRCSFMRLRACWP